MTRSDEKKSAAITGDSPVAAATPPDPALEPARRAFETGDYVRVRQLCRDLEASGDVNRAQAARALRSRTEADLPSVGVLIGCLALFVAVAYKYVL